MITIKKAIEIIQLDIDDESIDWTSPLGKAYKIAFEALKRITAWRNDNDEDLLWDLPGETADEEGG